MARFSIYGLSRLKVDARSWRPNLLVLSGSPQERWYLVELADAITHGKGFLTVVSLLVSKEKLEVSRLRSMERSVRDFLKKNDVPAFIEISNARDVISGAENVIHNYGLGPIVPNTIMLGETEKEERYADFVKLLQVIARLRRNILIVRKGREVPPISRFLRKPVRYIDVWWNRGFDNANLMLAMGHLIQTSPEWSQARLTLRSVVQSAEEREGAFQHLSRFILESRINANVEIYVDSGDPFETIRRESENSHLVFIGVKPFPNDTASTDLTSADLTAQTDYYKDLLQKTDGMPPVVLTLAAEDLQFKEIFK